MCCQRPTFEWLDAYETKETNFWISLQAESGEPEEWSKNVADGRQGVPPQLKLTYHDGRRFLERPGLKVALD